MCLIREVYKNLICMLTKNKMVCAANNIHISYASFISPFHESKLLRMYDYKDAIFVAWSILPLRTGLHSPCVSLIPSVFSSSDTIFAPVRSICLHRTSQNMPLFHRILGIAFTISCHPRRHAMFLVFVTASYITYAEIHRKMHIGVWVC